MLKFTQSHKMTATTWATHLRGKAKMIPLCRHNQYVVLFLLTVYIDVSSGIIHALDQRIDPSSLPGFFVIYLLFYFTVYLPLSYSAPSPAATNQGMEQPPNAGCNSSNISPPPPMQTPTASTISPTVTTEFSESLGLTSPSNALKATNTAFQKSDSGATAEAPGPTLNAPIANQHVTRSLAVSTVTAPSNQGKWYISDTGPRTNIVAGLQRPLRHWQAVPLRVVPHLTPVHQLFPT